MNATSPYATDENKHSRQPSDHDESGTPDLHLNNSYFVQTTLVISPAPRVAVATIDALQAGLGVPHPLCGQSKPCAEVIRMLRRTGSGF